MFQNRAYKKNGHNCAIIITWHQVVNLSLNLRVWFQPRNMEHAGVDHFIRFQGYTACNAIQFKAAFDDAFLFIVGGVNKNTKRAHNC